MIYVVDLLSTDRPAERMSGHGAHAALAIHRDVERIYQQAYNAHTFDFEKDVGLFMAPDITIVLGGTLETRSLLRDISNARADYVRDMGVTVTINSETTCVADLGTTVVLVAEGDFIFTYPDQTVYAQRVLASSTLRLLDGTWVFQHIHFG
jgi:SnoaL-like domain